MVKISERNRKKHAEIDNWTPEHYCYMDLEHGKLRNFDILSKFCRNFDIEFSKTEFQLIL